MSGRPSRSSRPDPCGSRPSVAADRLLDCRRLEPRAACALSGFGALRRGLRRALSGAGARSGESSQGGARSRVSDWGSLRGCASAALSKDPGDVCQGGARQARTDRFLVGPGVTASTRRRESLRADSCYPFCGMRFASTAPAPARTDHQKPSDHATEMASGDARFSRRRPLSSSRPYSATSARLHRDHDPADHAVRDITRT